MVKDFGPLLEGAIRGHDDRSLLIAQRHDLEEQIGALQAPRAQRSSRMPPSSRAVFSCGRGRGWSPWCRAPAASNQGAARSGWADASADTVAHAGGRKGRLHGLYSSAARTLTECLGPRIHAQPPGLSGLLTIPHARSEAPWVSGCNDFADTRPECSSAALLRPSW